MAMVEGKETQSPPQTPKGRRLMSPTPREAAGKSCSTTCSSCMKHPLQRRAFTNVSNAAQTQGSRNRSCCQGWVRPSHPGCKELGQDVPCCSPSLHDTGQGNIPKGQQSVTPTHSTALLSPCPPPSHSSSANNSHFHSLAPG